MKIDKYLISVYLLLLAVNIHGMNKESLKSLEKEAWEEAFNGDKAEALKKFTQAARAGSWQASKFLAHNYGKEPLIDEKDDKKAQFFLSQAEGHKKQRPNEYFSEFDLGSQIEKFKALQFARNNPWYKDVLDELNSSNSSYFKEYPLPEKSILRLFRKMKDDKVDKKKALERMRLLGQTMNLVQSKEATQEIFKQVNDGYHSFSFSDDANTNYSLSKDMYNEPYNSDQ